MKFSNLMLFTGAALVSYRLVKNRKEISQNVQETSQAWNKAQASLANIQRNMAIIQEQRDRLTEMSQDISYKYRVLEGQAKAQIAQIQDIWKKYE